MTNDNKKQLNSLKKAFFTCHCNNAKGKIHQKLFCKVLCCKQLFDLFDFDIYR